MLRTLGLSEADIVDVSHKHGGLREQTFAALSLWRDSYGEQATPAALSAALKTWNLHAAAGIINTTHISFKV